jgi:hypothetical protein
MKLLISTIISISALSMIAACTDSSHDRAYYQPQQQPQYQQQPQIIVQQAPQDTSSAVTAMVGGAAIGALAANAFNNRNQQMQVVTKEVAVQQAPRSITQPSQQKPWFKPETLPAKPVSGNVTTPKPVVAPTPSSPKPSFAPVSSYKQSAPSSKRK